MRCSGEAKAVVLLELLVFIVSELKKVALAPCLLLAMLLLDVSMEAFVMDRMAQVFNNLASVFVDIRVDEIDQVFEVGRIFELEVIRF